MEKSSAELDDAAWISHYGVKGMKWGVRKKHDDTPNAAYSKKDRKKDKYQMGNRGVKKINRRMNKGQDHKKARQAVLQSSNAKRMAAVGALFVVSALAESGSLSVGSIAQRADTNRQRATKAATRGLPSKPTNGPTYAKQRKGAYNITSM